MTKLWWLWGGRGLWWLWGPQILWWLWGRRWSDLTGGALRFSLSQPAAAAGWNCCARIWTETPTLLTACCTCLLIRWPWQASVAGSQPTGQFVIDKCSLPYSHIRNLLQPAGIDTHNRLGTDPHLVSYFCSYIDLDKLWFTWQMLSYISNLLEQTGWKCLAPRQTPTPSPSIFGAYFWAIGNG